MKFPSSFLRIRALRLIHSSTRRTVIPLTLFFLANALSVAAQKPPATKIIRAGTQSLAAPRKRAVPAAPSVGAPRLVVVLVIDQFRADYLDRFENKFGAGGFARLRREGAVFRSCFYPYAITETGPGHATLATGTTPDRHGIASNNWYDVKRKRSIYALNDDDSPVVGGRPGGWPGLAVKK